MRRGTGGAGHGGTHSPPAGAVAGRACLAGQPGLCSDILRLCVVLQVAFHCCQQPALRCAPVTSSSPFCQFSPIYTTVSAGKGRGQYTPSVAGNVICHSHQMISTSDLGVADWPPPAGEQPRRGRSWASAIWTDICGVSALDSQWHSLLSTVVDR